MADPKPNAKTTVLPLWTPSLPALWVLTGVAVAAVVVGATLIRTVGWWFTTAYFVLTTTTVWIRRRRPKRES
jgi:hypothetical protein